MFSTEDGGLSYPGRARAAYDLLTDGRMDLLKSLSIAVPAAIVWYAFRLLKDRLRDKQPPRQPKIN